jgi:hypothetical protein
MSVEYTTAAAHGATRVAMAKGTITHRVRAKPNKKAAPKRRRLQL